MALKMETLRLRLEFKNSDILTDAQKSLGLEKSWVLVNQPNINFTTVATLCQHILHKFQLNQSCPHGLLLSMDGFALPPFVSIGILKDKDVISVQKIGHLTVEGSDPTDKDEELHVMAINGVSTGTMLLSNEEFGKEKGGYESEELDNESAEDGNVKTTASQKLKSSKKKKQQSEPRGTVSTGIHGESENIETPHESEAASGKKSKPKKRKSTENQTIHGDNTTPDAKTKKDVESASNLKKDEQFQENGEGIDDATNACGSTQKRPSRSSRRQYAKRTMLREMKKVWKNEDSPSKEVKKLKKRHNKVEKRAVRDELLNEGSDQPKGLLHLKQFGGKDISKVWSKPEEENQNHKSHGNSNKDNDTSNDVVPVEIRPGHICFEGNEEDHEVQPSQVSLIDFTSLVDVRTVKNNNIDLSASTKGIAKHAGKDHICNENGITSMPLDSNEKCADSMVKSNGSTDQDNSAHAPSTPENGVDLWEKLSEALSSKKEGLSKESKWGKITASNRNTSSYGAFESSTVCPTSYRGRGRGRSNATSYRGRGRNNSTMSYRGRGRNYG